MILDALENWRLYGAGRAWELAFERLLSLGPEAEPGEYELDGRDVFLIVFDTTTKALLDTTLEAHRVYADIHLPLTGPEVHARFALAGLAETKPYDPAADAAHYDHPDRFTALFTLHPGQFALYLPGEAHLSQGKVDPRPQPLRKAVVKVRADLLRP
ncbi:YhcH/YjgK/YiaL family protein [Humidesulfovibrio mexicanus]|uniref:YhcH/YjgK/YiaL family protein n=1 Tax=Humidesulfovibrio mexicanus TaxID=147047 RepID=A0A239B1T9_9BACT|nr:YhcH/YjgK/YiaL family protein [Humidesulfovibrio mexicanus]SNS01542.1 YhcH/YjgK/YiaL family protein [Humidesulfovibrio mexicanus]